MSPLKKYRFLVYLVPVLIIIMTSCSFSTPTPQPTIFNPGCSVVNLINNLNYINQQTDPAVINLDAGCVYTLTQVDNTMNAGAVTIQNGLPRITKTITINGNNAIIDIQGPVMGHFYIEPSGDLELYDLTLSNGARQFGGAVINLQGDFFASHTTFLNNVAYPDGDLIGRGGAIYNDSGRVRIINNSHFQENHAGETLTSGFNLGGAIFNVNGALIVSTTSFHQNYAAGQGGAIYSMKDASDEAGEFITINEVEFLENHAFDNGGALMLLDESSTVFIVRSEFTENRADNYGGGLYAAGSNVEGTENDFSNNSAVYGGAVYTRRLSEELDSTYEGLRSSFYENTASEVGGAIYSENSDLSMDGALMVFNEASSCGAISTGGDPAIDIVAGDLASAPQIHSSTQIIDSHFYGNEALQSHGGAVCHVMGELSIEDTELVLNHAVSMGGALLILDESQLSGINVNSNNAERGGGVAIGYPYNYTPGMTIMGPIHIIANTSITGSNFTYNEGTFRGGGLWVDHIGSTTISKSTFSFNSTDFTGGGMFLYGGDTFVSNSTFAWNTALRGGGIYGTGTLTSNPILEIKHTTIAHNTATEAPWGFSREVGGGLNVGGDVTLTNSLVTQNSPSDCQIDDSYTNFTAPGTVDSDGECNASLTEANPDLGPLSWNGGTPTMALLASSPLIDILSDCAGLPDDQRGVSRPQGSACDPGSYEFDPSDPPIPPPMPPDIPPDTADSSDRCDPFAGREVSLLLLNLPQDTLNLPVVLKMDDGGPVPGLDPAAMNGSPLAEYRAILGDYESYQCTTQGFPDRLICMFKMPANAPGMALDLKVYVNDCEDPAYFQPMVSIPEPQSGTQCTVDLEGDACTAAGGSPGRSGCVCP